MDKVENVIKKELENCDFKNWKMERNNWKIRNMKRKNWEIVK